MRSRGYVAILEIAEPADPARPSEKARSTCDLVSDTPDESLSGFWMKW